MINSLSLRSNYKTLKKFTYLNQASLGLISEKTATSMIEFLNEIAKPINETFTGLMCMPQGFRINFV